MERTIGAQFIRSAVAFQVWLHVIFGDVTAIKGMFFGLKCAVLPLSSRRFSGLAAERSRTS
ncbi:hypothetical protein Q8X45_25220 (plasmid) [Agrobacterium fabrum]|nr:hypothetical protein [Agrobacterium fabrum]MCR6727294.1 hypothetical protein [Agrobacterium fabrum]MDH6297944.1 hypothetical protein [Agrobacterium fabrum]WLP57290.1 hypothetical protein Q8X45_25220 [Agrobacterium fabrum]